MQDILKDFNKGFNLASEISLKQDMEKLILVIENWKYVNENIKPIFIDIIESFGFYPYLKHLTNSLNIPALIRNEYHKSAFLKDAQNKNLVFHFEQKILEEKISNKQNLLISAPTSFGKSLLIEEFIARKIYDNILIIQPTLALIDETRKKLQKYTDAYNIVLNTSQEIKHKNIFILTSERVLDILPKINNIDLFIVDEFYKISNHKHDDRVSQLNIAFYKVMFKKPQLILLTPLIDNVDNNFIQKYGLNFFKTEYSLVRQELEKINYETKKEKRMKLFELLNNLSEPTIVYVKSPAQAEDLSSDFIKENKKDVKKTFPIFEWIDKNVSIKWNLKKYLQKGIGLHNGQYPRHIANAQLDYFNNNEINILFATTSLIEGVNTVAKNIIIYDMHKGPKKLTNFDFNNIKGRAGRMMKYYTGKVYYFDNPPKQEIEHIDVPIVTQDNNLQSEILINLEKEDIREGKKRAYEELIQGLPVDLLQIFKSNYYSIEKQKSLYCFLKDNKEILDKLSWDIPIPTYELLSYTLRIIDYCLENKKGSGYKFLAQKCHQIIQGENLYSIISNEIKYQQTLKVNQGKSEESIISLSVSKVFGFIRNQAKFEIPKRLGILESIVNYLNGNKAANYSAFISILEHEGIDSRLSILLDFGVPAATLKKFKDIPDNDIIEHVKNNFKKMDLSEYEVDILRRL
ncbi:MAG: DEAD/DEAH box helicase [Campylobacter sp.]